MTSDDAPSPSAPSCPILPSYPIIPGLLGRRSISLIVGAPYSGKSALLLPAIAEYLSTGILLGYPAPQNPSDGGWMLARCGYLCCDRSLDEIAADLHSAQLPALTVDQFPYVSWQDSRPKDDAPTLDDLYSLFPTPRPQLLIVEALQVLMPSGKISDYQEVMRFYSRLKRFCREHDVTILGTVGTSKTGTGEDYHVPTPLGSVAWENGASTLMRLELAESFLPRQQQHQQAPTRRLTILTRRNATRTLWYDFDESGALVLVPEPTDWREGFVTRLVAIPEGDPIPRTTFLAWGDDLKVCRASVDQWLVECLTRSVLEKVKQGTYRKPYRT